MPKTIIINGYPGSGKDTFVDFCIDYIRGFDRQAIKLSSVDKAKEAAFLLGWDGVKDEWGRRFLSDLKDLSTKFFDGPTLYMENEIFSLPDDVVVFLMIREPDEIAKFVGRNDGTLTVFVNPWKDVEEASNHADEFVANYPYDFVVPNDWGLGELIETAHYFSDLIITKVNKYQYNTDSQQNPAKDGSAEAEQEPEQQEYQPSLPGFERSIPALS